MTINETTTVAAIAATVPSSVRVFQRHGIDFCCGGRKPIGEACREQGVSLADVTREIDSEQNRR
jgi:regulator of cell morphogenesis and NO signaling